jgi:hypothetical protein
MFLSTFGTINSYLRTECEKTFFGMSALFEARATKDECFICANVPNTSSRIQIREMVFSKPQFIIIKSNYFQNAQKGECFLDDFEAPVRVRGYYCGHEMCHFEGSEFKKLTDESL